MNKTTSIEVPKRWQPINILIGALILIVSFANLFSKEAPPPLFPIFFGPALIFALILIFTRRNNYLSGIFLAIFGFITYGIFTIVGAPPPMGFNFLANNDFSLLTWQTQILDISTLLLRYAVIFGSSFMIVSAFFVKHKKNPKIIYSLVISFIILILIIMYTHKEIPTDYNKFDFETWLVDKIYFTNSAGENKTKFIPGEAIYPFPETSRLKHGTKYGFKVIDANGNEIVPFSEQTTAHIGLNDAKWDFNTKENPATPGVYTVELFVIGYEKAFLTARETVQVTLR